MAVFLESPHQQGVKMGMQPLASGGPESGRCSVGWGNFSLKRCPARTQRTNIPSLTQPPTKRCNYSKAHAFKKEWKGGTVAIGVCKMLCQKCIVAARTYYISTFRTIACIQ